MIYFAPFSGGSLVILEVLPFPNPAYWGRGSSCMTLSCDLSGTAVERCGQAGKWATMSSNCVLGKKHQYWCCSINSRYSWPLNNAILNRKCPLIHEYFSVFSTTVLQTKWLVGSTDVEALSIWRANYKLLVDKLCHFSRVNWNTKIMHWWYSLLKTA